MSLLSSYLAILSQIPVRHAFIYIIVSSCVLAFGIPTLANNSEPIVLIENQAVGSFLDNDDRNIQLIESNVVDGVELDDNATTNSSDKESVTRKQTDTSRETVQ